jgi:ubiquitin-protein ligase E3 D
MSLDINLYAEFLMNIRSVTIYGTLRNENSKYTKAYVSSDQKTISLTYDGKTTSIALPLGIKVKGSVGFPVSDPAEISLRLEVLEADQPSHGLQMEVDNDTPWPANCLGTETQIACRQCHSLVVLKANRTWKDLPRGLWAETLDQWYCHRPTAKEHQEPQHHGSAGPRLEAGLGFVDTCHLILPIEDCQTVQVSTSLSYMS